MKYILIATCLSIQIVSQAQPVIVNNDRTNRHQALMKIKLSTIPPQGYRINSDGNGYYKTVQGSNEILVTRCEKLFTDFASIRASLLQNQPDAQIEYRINDYGGLLIKKDSSYLYNGTTYTIKNMVFAFGNDSYCYLLASAVPDVYANEEVIIKASFLSAIVDTFGYSQKVKSNAKEYHLVNNVVDPAGTDFKLADMTDDNHFIYTKDGAYPPLATDKSVFTTSKDPDIVDTSAWEDFMKQTFGLRSDISNQHIDQLKRKNGLSLGLLH